ncbi:MAG: TetR family transcriptional regulator, partial [Actinobacteria bacterium]|nr:TetR/AcrR family transcriptional regulator [Actinomycetota bacterium]NIS35764.1 TetR/AcrR family transcriptional regulator [Actinomycetota bacterium]NIU70390.1 TetR/AcrR family transcriptional regulator [Actinomycetota bacterium]NIV58491.1 TetR family transcriptional regulator [Actinomycetota bacterium]NIV90054.1 TetR family transcriptional regulator [Actinomycetota bacterium]
MPRIGLTPDRVAEAAAALIDTEGENALTLGRLADELGVKAPSLYNHVEGIGDLRRRIAMRGIADLAEALRSAVLGRSGGDALQHL